MVSVSSLHSLSQHPCHYNSKPPSSLNKSLHLLKPNSTLNCFLTSIPSGIFRSCRVICCSSSKTRQESVQQDDPFVCPGELAGDGAKRREALYKIAFSALSFPTIVSQALAATDVAESVRVYTDDENKFKISIPQDWEVGAGGDTSGFKSVTAFYPEGASSSSSVSVVITGVGPDFTRLESFGKVEAFAETLIGGLDRSWQRPPGVAAKLIDCKASNGLYYIEYTLQNPGESRRHLFSALGMASNGWINRLYTITGQFVDEESEKYCSQIQKSVSSFRLISV